MLPGNMDCGLSTLWRWCTQQVSMTLLLFTLLRYIVWSVLMIQQCQSVDLGTHCSSPVIVYVLSSASLSHPNSFPLDFSEGNGCGGSGLFIPVLLKVMVLSGSACWLLYVCVCAGPWQQKADCAVLSTLPPTWDSTNAPLPQSCLYDCTSVWDTRQSLYP